MDPKLFVYICFGIWAVGTFLIFALQVYKPIPIQGKFYPVRSARHHLMLVTIMAWLAMWCFRSMY